MVVDISATVLLFDLAPSAVLLVAYGVSWWILLGMSMQRQSRGLFLMSLGFLVKLVLDGSWTIFYWSLGGPLFIITLLQQGNSVQQASTTIALIGWIGTGLSLASLAALIALLVSGAIAMTEAVPTFSKG